MTTSSHTPADYDLIQFGQWVREQRKAAGYSLSTLAKAVSITHANAKSTLSGIEAGRRRIDAERRRKLVEALARPLSPLDPPHQQAPGSSNPLKESGMRVAGLSPSAIGLAIPISTSLDDRLLNRAEYLLMSAPFMLYGEHPHADMFLTEAADTYARLLARASRDPDIAFRGAQVGEYLARAQEATRPWFERSLAGAATYTHALQFLVEPARDLYPRSRQLQLVQARLLALRAPLYRELKHFQAGAHDAEVGFELATRLGDTIVQADIVRNIAHALAAQGNVAMWRRALDRAAAVVERDTYLDASIRAAMFALHDYYTAEGLKRLAYTYRAELTWTQREAYAQSALARFANAREQLHLHWARLTELGAGLAGHPLITSVSEAQCRVWIDPDRALIDLDELEQRAEIIYRSLLPKIAFARQCAHIIRNRKRSNPRPDDATVGFDLDLLYQHALPLRT